jgi:hypothetical protein
VDTQQQHAHTAPGRRTCHPEPKARDLLLDPPKAPKRL